MQEMYCFLEIFTQLATILHDCRPASTIAFNWFCLWRWQYFFSPCKGTSAHRASSGRCRWHSDKVRHLPRPLGIGVKWHYIPTLQFVYHSQAKFMTGFSCWLLPSFVPPKGLKLDHRRSWSSILLSRRRGRGTWCTTLTGRCIFELQNQIRAKKTSLLLFIPMPTYHLTASRRAQGQVRQHQVVGTCRIFHSRSSFLTPGRSRSYLKTCAEQTQRNSLLFHDLLAALSTFYKRYTQNNSLN